MKNSELGKKMVEARQAKGWTQNNLAEKAHVSLRTIQRIESGQVNLRAFTIKQLCEILGLDYMAMLKDFECAASKRQKSKFRGAEAFLRPFSTLFTLKIKRLKRRTILSLLTILLGFYLFSIFKDAKNENLVASKNTPYIIKNSRRITYIVHDGYKVILSNVNDTLELSLGSNLIQEYKRNVYPNKFYMGFALEGNTLKYNEGTISILHYDE